MVFGIRVRVIFSEVPESTSRTNHINVNVSITMPSLAKISKKQE